MIDPTESAVAELAAIHIRPVAIWTQTPEGLVPVWEPPLTADELAVLARIRRAVRSAVPGITPDEWLVLEPDLAALRLFRQQSQAEFIALTQNQRDRALFDVVNAQTNVIRALLRDE